MISLKIENLLLNNIILNNKEETFKEGSTFIGKIIELLDQRALIDIKGHGTLQATLETDLKLILGDEISFLVKSSNDNKIVLKPLMVDDIQLNNIKESSSISKLLYSFNIKETKLSIGLAENLMKYNAPITEQNLVEGIKNLEKVIQLISMNDEEKVILINSSVKNITTDESKEQFAPITDVEIKESFKTENNNSKNITFADKESFVDKESFIDKEDIKYLLVVNKNDYPDKKDFSIIVKEFLGNENNVNVNANSNINVSANAEDEYVKLISFLVKHNIKPSLNNIKNIREFNNNPIEFAEDFKLINTLISKLEHGKTTEGLLDNGADISSKEIISNRESKLDELQKLIQNFDSKINLQSKEELRNLENKIEFLRDLNKDLSFLFLPIHYGKDSLDGILTLLKEKKNKKTMNDKINIFINVNTNNLGNIKISCQLTGNSLNIKINIKNEDLKLFQSKEKHLIEKILSIGYILNKVEYVINNDIQIIDNIVSNPNPTYILDLKV